MEFPFSIQNKTIPIYYRLRKLTLSQREFISNTLESMTKENHKVSVHSLSPILDKDFLVQSCIVSLSLYLYQKTIILVNSEKEVFEMNDKIGEIINNHIYKPSSEINQTRKTNESSNDNNLQEKYLIPFLLPMLDRKYMCINETAMNNASSIDFDYYCYKETYEIVKFRNESKSKSKITEKNSINDSLNNNNSTNGNNLTTNSKEKVRGCKFYNEYCNYSEVYLGQRRLKKELISPLFELMDADNYKHYTTFIKKKHICPYYFTLNTILENCTKSNYHKSKRGCIIISTVKEFYDIKKNLNWKTYIDTMNEILIKTKKANKEDTSNDDLNTSINSKKEIEKTSPFTFNDYNITILDSENLENAFTEILTMNIDDTWITTASKQVEQLSKSVDLNQEITNIEMSSLNPIYESITFSTLNNYLIKEENHRMMLEKKEIKDNEDNNKQIENDSKTLLSKYPGNIRKNSSFINTLYKILLVIKNKMLVEIGNNSSISQVLSINYLKYYLLKENIELSSIKYLLLRLLNLFTENHNIFFSYNNNSQNNTNLLSSMLNSNNNLIIKNQPTGKNMYSEYYHLISLLHFISLIEVFTNDIYFGVFGLHFTTYFTHIPSPKEVIKHVNCEIALFNKGKLIDVIFNSKFIIKEKFDKLKEKYSITLNVEEEIQKESYLQSILWGSELRSKCFFLSGLPNEIDIYKKLEFNNSKNFVFYNSSEINNDNSTNNINLLLEQELVSKNIDYTYVSPENTKNLTFYANVLIKTSNKTPEGIICYFSSYKLLEEYLYLWNISNSNNSTGNEYSVFNNILNDRLIFVEDLSNKNIGETLTDYMKACDSGRGGILFLSIRNNLSELIDGKLKGHYAKSLIFLGFPLETRISNNTKLDVKLKMFHTLYDINQEEFILYNAFSLINKKIISTIKDFNDKKFVLLLDEKILYHNESMIEKYFYSWLADRLKVEESFSYLEEKVKKLSFD